MLAGRERQSRDLQGPEEDPQINADRHRFRASSPGKCFQQACAHPRGSAHHTEVNEHRSLVFLRSLTSPRPCSGRSGCLSSQSHAHLLEARFIETQSLADRVRRIATEQLTRGSPQLQRKWRPRTACAPSFKLLPDAGEIGPSIRAHRYFPEGTDPSRLDYALRPAAVPHSCCQATIISATFN